MEAQMVDDVSPSPRVKVTFQLGSETHQVQANNGILSQQLVSVKEQSMSILKEFITKHNIPNDIPDDPEEVSSDDEEEVSVKPVVKKSKKQQ